LGLLDKRTDEEKAAARRAKEEARARLAAAEAQRQAELAAAQAAEAERYGKFVATLPKWEYKVLTNTALAGWGNGTIQGLEPLLNQWASEGWRVVSMSFTGQISQTLAADKNHLYVVLERPALYGGHAGPPVQTAAPPPAPPTPPVAPS
jgi:hypothetical protein